MEKQEMIEHIKNSFGTYGRNDILFNAEKPIAAFILAATYIDGLSAFRYNSEEEDRWVRFVKEYLPMYNVDQLYDSLKLKLLPYYSLDGSYYKIGYGTKEGMLPNYIHVEDFVKNISDAYEKCMEDMEADNFNTALLFAEKHFVIA